MKPIYIILASIVILGYNAFLIKRDANMFEAYDRACAQLPTAHPDCIFAKKK